MVSPDNSVSCPEGSSEWALRATVWRPQWRVEGERKENRASVPAKPVANASSQFGKPGSQRDDEASLIVWMTQYQAGDEGAFDALHGALAPRLGRFLRWCGRSSDRVEDLVQESFLQIHRSRHTYRPGCPVTPWAFAIANYVRLMDRRSRRARRLDHGAEDLTLEEVPTPRRCPETTADRLRLEAALSIIDVDHRGPFLLHHVWGYSFEEIGRILGISRGAAKNRSYRASRVLRDILMQKL